MNSWLPFLTTNTILVTECILLKVDKCLCDYKLGTINSQGELFFRL